MVDKKEVYEYRAKWPVYGLSWSVRPDKPYRLALGSFIEEYTNQVASFVATLADLFSFRTTDPDHSAERINWGVRSQVHV